MTTSLNTPPLAVLPSDIIFHRELNLIDYRLFVLLSSHGNRKMNNLVWVSVQNMADTLKESRSRIYESLEKLQGLSLIKDTGGTMSKGVRVWKVLTTTINEILPSFPTVSTPNPPVSTFHPPVSKIDTQTEDLNREDKTLQTEPVILPVEKTHPIEAVVGVPSPPLIKKEKKAATKKEEIIVDFPEDFPKSLIRAVKTLLRMAPTDQRQELVNEFSYRIKNTTIKNYVAYFARLVNLAKDEIFVPRIESLPEQKKKTDMRAKIDLWKSKRYDYAQLESPEMVALEAEITEFYKSINHPMWEKWQSIC